ncbi:MAG: hypothetical protein KDD55_00900 [Bdellovibrionales bacterium]|nr:hypothetical protein [Bdellovibrionales bacterium]
MELDAGEVRAGWTWLVVAGAIAIAFSLFLYNADERLTNSDRDVRLGQTLRELRTAQFTVSGAPSDLRMVSPDLRRDSQDHSSH